MKNKIIDQYMHTLRSTVNEAIFINNIKRHKFVWDMAIASIDTIEDTQLAIESFSNTKFIGKRYLEVYGLFQAIFLEQDALVNLAKGLNLDTINIWSNKESADIRAIRNKYFGHPTKNDHKKQSEITYHGVARMTIDSDSITGWTYPNFKTEVINIPKVIDDHYKSVKTILKQINDQLIQKGDDYMSSFNVPLSVNQHDYEFQKIYLWITGSRNDGIMAKGSLKVLSEAIQKVKTGLGDRYENTDSFGLVMRDIKKAEYCLAYLSKMMDESNHDSELDFNGEVHVDSLKQSIEEINVVCSEINDDFLKSQNKTTK